MLPQKLNIQNDGQHQKFVEAYQAIVLEALKHTFRAGYLSFRLDANFLLIADSFQFIQGDFCKEEFEGIDNSNFKLPPEAEVTDAFYIYFSILGADNVTKWKLRKLVITIK